MSKFDISENLVYFIGIIVGILLPMVLMAILTN